jgi:Bardet-Biedl syndrome 2 protein
MSIKCDNMDLVGDIVQDLATYLDLAELQVTADFPKAMAAFKDVLVKVSSGPTLPVRP